MTCGSNYLRYDPADPTWPNRDRFVLSNGHASMLLYSLLHLAEVKALDANGQPTGKLAVTLDNIKHFRQLDSPCAGHPESNICSPASKSRPARWVKAWPTASAWPSPAAGLAVDFNKPDFNLFDFDVYAICGDGCMMEGISGEAASLAGHLKLSNLCWLYDCNHISIEGATSLAFTEDVGKRFEAYGWNVTSVEDANDLGQLEQALERIQENQRSADVHHRPQPYRLGFAQQARFRRRPRRTARREEVKLTKRDYGWPEDAQFSDSGRRCRQLPPEHRPARRKAAPGLGGTLQGIFQPNIRTWPTNSSAWTNANCLPGWDKDLPTFPARCQGAGHARKFGQGHQRHRQKRAHLHRRLGRSCLRRPRRGSLTRRFLIFEADNYGGRNLRFGVREHAMGAILNGLAVSKVRSFGSGFLIFSDYGKTPIRLAALMEIPVIYVFTHDSIGLGEDGPTHQPIEQLASLRAIPGMITLRPADAAEVVEAWKYIMPLQASAGRA